MSVLLPDCLLEELPAEFQVSLTYLARVAAPDRSGCVRATLELGFGQRHHDWFRLHGVRLQPDQEAAIGRALDELGLFGPSQRPGPGWTWLLARVHWGDADAFGIRRELELVGRGPDGRPMALARALAARGLAESTLPE